MLETFFQSPAKKILSKYKEQVDKINALENNLIDLTDTELREQTNQLRKRLLAGEAKNSITNESFALVREASKRTLGLRHFDVQIIGGLILNEGKIAEMKTGEGKTLVALLPTFLNALTGKGTHVITVNDYLARRDAELMGQVHRFLGLTVGLIQENMDPPERKENYNCDVVYVTNNELGFDYLRDNMAYDSDEIVQRPFFYCVIDEVDSILIDEARTPLIISGVSETPTEKYLQTKKLATSLKNNIHYKVDEKAQNVTLTNEGVLFCEQALGLVDLYSPDEPWIPYILNSVKAKELFTRNKNYIVNQNNEVIIVDEFTGRTMAGRRWSDGLHQAVEAKEDLPIQEESQTLASISYQNLFLLYEKLSGMTGTAKTEEAEFEKIYNLNVVTVPTNRDIKRKDFSDYVYKNEYIKWRCIAQECLEMYNLGRPVLIGTTTIEKSELLAALLSEYKVPYRLLNARPENVESESEIVAQAGCKKAITIATNMAGRGTDIVLGGNSTFLTNRSFESLLVKEDELDGEIVEKILKLEDRTVIENVKLNYKEFLKQPILDLEKQKKPEILLFVKLYKAVLEDNQKIIGKEGQDVRNLGGLHVIGTERHESRRIDNQLRGRSGRQGDPGSSRFFLSLEDKLLRIFGGDKILDVMKNIGFEDNTPIQSSILDSSLESAQKKVEAFYFDTRKQLFEYDEALNVQRDSIYNERRSILQKLIVRDWFVQFAEKSLDDLFIKFKVSDDIETSKFITLKLQNLLGIPFHMESFLNQKDLEKDVSFLQQQIQIAYDVKELEMEIIQVGLLRELEKTFILQQIDRSWMEHLQKMAFLRDSVRWIAYGQKNPLTEYKKEAFNYFNIMLAKIRHRVVYFVLRSKIILQ
jgi:preprotein translocase subunit SecA